MPVRVDRAEAVGAGAEDAADELIGDLGGGGVDHALEHAAVGEALHRPPAGAGGVEDEAVAAIGRHSPLGSRKGS